MARRLTWVRDFLRPGPARRAAILAALATADEALNAAELARMIPLGHGIVASELVGLETDGFVTSGWEPPEPPGWLHRRVYRITETGMLERQMQVQ